MKQIVQKLKTGMLNSIDVNLPSINPGQVLVRNYYSLISAGTESSTVRTARKGYIGKAKERPEQVKQVIQTFKTQGPIQTYRAVMKKLDSYSPLGYSCVGKVVDMASDVRGFSVGDFVACGGLSASHAEIVGVPVNLCVRLNPKTNLKQAAYNTLGAIALQGVRQANLRLGETCAVIGLGLIGQLTCLLLRASGIRVIGTDVDATMVDIAAKNCADIAINRNSNGIENRVQQFTENLGCDAVIITAASSSLDPINFAGAISRKRGTIVVVGSVPTGFDREPHYYKKELQIKMSCSYGPGRYDPNYEEKGIDYPSAYVRWTEKRNMEAFQTLLYEKKIDLNYLTTHIFSLAEAPAAYDLMMSQSDHFIGILIEYDTNKEINSADKKIQISSSSYRPSSVNIGFIGAGSYAQGNLIPNIPRKQNYSLMGVATSSGTTSRSVAERFGFEFCASDATELLENKNINTIFIATRHNSHADFVKASLKAGKHVFVEKPLCLNEQELKEIFGILTNDDPHKKIPKRDQSDINQKPLEMIERSPANPIVSPILMVGFNRRFAPLAKEVKKMFSSGPMAMIYRINAGKIPTDSWIQDPDIGGGRIIGEVCHFIDFLTYVNGSLPLSVFSSTMIDPQHLNDVLNISITYANGSIGTISYFANGNKRLQKERIEIYANQCTAIIDDFKSMFIYTDGGITKNRLLNQDKGQKQEVLAFITSVLEGSQPPIPYEEIYSSSLVSFKVLESIRTGKCVQCHI